MQVAIGDREPRKLGTANAAGRFGAAPASCELCGGPIDRTYHLERIWHQPRGSASHRVIWCSRCGFGRLDPLPSQAELDRLYGADYFATYAGERPSQSVAPPTVLDRVRVKAAWLLDRGASVTPEAVRELLGPPPKAWCDVGCGNATLLGALANSGYTLTGVEADVEARKRAEVLGVTALPGYAEALPQELDDRTFDLVTMFHVLEHCRSPVDAAANVARLVAPGGHLLIEVPNNACLGARARGPAWYHADAGRHLSFFTARSLEAVVRPTGLRIESIRYGQFVAQFTNERRSAEQEVFDRLYADRVSPSPPPCRRNSAIEQWMTLALASLAPRRHKYEVVRIVARRDRP